MDTLTINEIIKKDQLLSKSFLGVFARDQLPRIVRYPASFILNTETSSKSGEHWLAFYIDKKKFCYFFDSYGNKPSKFRLQNFLNSNFTNWTYNQTQLQGFSDYCGYYCILFLLFVSRNKLHEFFNEFRNNSFINDKKLRFLIKKFD